jgi:hypothetical protein
MSKLIPVSDDEKVGRRSIGRRIKNPPPGFPRPVRINGRLYFVDSELDAYKKALIAGGLSMREAPAG